MESAVKNFFKVFLELNFEPILFHVVDNFEVGI